MEMLFLDILAESIKLLKLIVPSQLLLWLPEN